jgi:hypothetical protein
VASLGDECLSENQHLPFCWSGPPKIASAEAGAAEIRAVMATVAAAIVNCRIMPSPWFPVGFVSCSVLPGCASGYHHNRRYKIYAELIF